MTVPRFAVVGGGITGLTAAHALATGREPAQVDVFEATPRLGGKIHTGELDGVPVELGADAFLTSGAAVLELCTDLGLAHDLVRPDAAGVQVWVDGRAHPLPDGVVLGAPARIGPLVRSRLLDATGVARAMLDLVLPARVDVQRASVGELVAARFGPQVRDRLVDPLLGGVYAGDVDRLSVTAATPRLAAAAAHRSLLRGLRATRGDRDRPGFRSVRGGLTRLVDALAATPDLEIHRASPVRGLETAGAGYRLEVGDLGVDVDGVVLAVPAFAAANLLEGVAPAAAAPLRGIAHASIALVLLAIGGDAPELEGSGMLVPSTEGRLVKAATWVSRKWASVMPGGRTIIRASVGRRGDDIAERLDDDELVRGVLDDLRDFMGLDSAPDAVRVVRWKRGLPQYEVGHEERVTAVDNAIAGLPGLVVGGAWRDGIGIPARVEQGRRLAEDVTRTRMR